MRADDQDGTSSMRIRLDLKRRTPLASTPDHRGTALSLVDFETPDPFLVQAANGRLYMTFTCGNRIDVLSASSLAAFRTDVSRHTLWTPPQCGPCSSDIWAPELHVVRGRWYIYFAAAHPTHGNASHGMYVLGGPPAEADPVRAAWQYLGPLRGMPADQWAIDGTLFELRGQLYFMYSGWPRGQTRDDMTQELFLTRLLSPTCVSSAPIRVCKPEYPWEFTHDARGIHGINEGPQFLASPAAAWEGIVYSCAGSWTNEYKMNALQYIGGDPMSSSAWRKSKEPLLQTAPLQFAGPYAPGHGNFLTIGHDTIAIFHATDGPFDGWANRKARVQRVFWTESPTRPHMGIFVGRLVTDVDAFTKFAPQADEMPWQLQVPR